MHSKNNRVNHDFQIAYFLAGGCHTPDGAYAILRDLQEDREMALAGLESAELNVRAKILRAEKTIAENKDESDVLEAKAELINIANNKKFSQRNIDAAKKELEFINQCIDRLQAQRKYAHLPDPEAHEAMQQEEWKYELMSRAENFLLTTGSIPTDQFQTMRMHPDFLNEILPTIERTKQMMIEQQDKQLLIENLNKNKPNIPLLLGSE